VFDRFVDLAEKIIQVLKSRNVEGDVYCEYSKSITVECQEGKFKGSSISEECGLGLRVVVDNSVGFVYTSSLDVNPVDLVDRAFKIAKLCSKISWRGLPKISKPVNVSDIFNRDLANIDVEYVLSYVNEFLKYYEGDRDIFSIWFAGIEVSYTRRFIINTNGVELECEETSSTAGLEVNARNGTYTTPGVYDFECSRVKIVDLVKVYERCKDKARRLLKPVKLDYTNIDVVLSPKALTHLLEYTLLSVLNSRAFALKRSPFIGKIGQELFSRELTLIDDATKPGDLESTPFDDEGVPTRRVILIEKGVLKNVISDIYWGSIANLETTGNGYRSGYYSTPTVSFTNVEILPGSLDLEELKSGKVLLVDDVQGAHSSNPESGEFSVAAPCAWIIENGSEKPVKGVMISGNMYTILRDVKFTKQVEKFVNFTLPYAYVYKENIKVIA